MCLSEAAKLLEFDLRCRQLTGLQVKKASISIGRLLNYHWHSLLEVDPMLRAALLPICDCTPRRLQQCMTLMLKRYPDPRGTMRWAMHLLGQLAPVLDWEVVLAYARFADPAVAEHTLTQASRPDGSQTDAPPL